MRNNTLIAGCMNGIPDGDRDPRAVNPDRDHLHMKIGVVVTENSNDRAEGIVILVFSIVSLIEGGGLSPVRSRGRSGGF